MINKSASVYLLNLSDWLNVFEKPYLCKDKLFINRKEKEYVT
jgi:hypothetical protein